MHQYHLALIPEKVNDENDPSQIRNHRLVENSIAEQILRIANPNQDVGKHGDPIQGYADEPLLPLADACAPLKTIVLNLSVYVKLALDETGKGHFARTFYYDLRT
jgi:hypothetical protein